MIYYLHNVGIYLNLNTMSLILDIDSQSLVIPHAAWQMPTVYEWFDLGSQQLPKFLIFSYVVHLQVLLLRKLFDVLWKKYPTFSFDNSIDWCGWTFGTTIIMLCEVTSFATFSYILHASNFLKQWMTQQIMWHFLLDISFLYLISWSYLYMT